MRESDFWKKVKQVLYKDFLTYRIESSVTPGFPDVVAIHRKTAAVYFIELKSWKSTRLTPMHGSLTTAQRNFHTNVRKVGANNFVIGIDGNRVCWIAQPDGINYVNWVRIHELQDITVFLTMER